MSGELTDRLANIEAALAAIAEAVLLMDAAKDIERYGIKAALQEISLRQFPEAVAALKKEGFI